jgi:alpha-tubulin suppressor-like RCC1 family protein
MRRLCAAAATATAIIAATLAAAGLAMTPAGLYTWGQNGEGQLGNGTSTSSDQPVQVHLPAGLAATAVFSGESAFFAVALVGKS